MSKKRKNRTTKEAPTPEAIPVRDKPLTEGELERLRSVYVRIGDCLEMSFEQFAARLDPSFAMEDIETWSSIAAAHEQYFEPLPMATSEERTLVCDALFDIGFGCGRPDDISDDLWELLQDLYDRHAPEDECLQSRTLWDGPLRQESLTQVQYERIRRLYESVGHYILPTLEQFERSFLRTKYPDQRIEIWDRISSVFQEVIAQQTSDIPIRKMMIHVLIAIASGHPRPEHFSTSVWESLRDSYYQE
jgi:hypothetical protein